MPTPILPLTPSASTDISAQDKQWRPAIEPSLTLPPPAMQGASDPSDHSPSIPDVANSIKQLDSTRTSSTGNKKSRTMPASEPFSLPSPPTRTRKIIQMKPPRPQQPDTQSPNKRRKTTSASAPTANPTSAALSNATSSSMVAKPTKKAIRKTAHSLIERRRRSKMNEAFSTLKDMIPACRAGDDEKGKEMHKLDVLNAGIEYLGYLERCLQSMNERAWGSVVDELDGEPVEETEGEKVLVLGTKRKADIQSPYLDRQQHHHPSHPTEQQRDSQPHAQECHCRCPCHNSSHAQPNTALPLSPPPSLEPRPQEHTLTQALAYGSRDFDRDREETTNTAAALLMLTSTDRRRSNDQLAPRPSSPVPAPHNTATSPSHHHHYRHHHQHHQHHMSAETNTPSPPIFHHQRRESVYGPGLGHDQPFQHPDLSRSRPATSSTTTPTIKAGLSVRDLLLSTN